MKLIIVNNGTIIKAEAIDYIDIRFNDSGDHICIYLSSHGVPKNIEYVQQNIFLFTENDGRLYETTHGILRCDVMRNRNRCICAIKDQLIEYLNNDRKNPFNLDDAVRYVVNDIKPVIEEVKEND